MKANTLLEQVKELLPLACRCPDRSGSCDACQLIQEIEMLPKDSLYECECLEGDGMVETVCGHILRCLKCGGLLVEAYLSKGSTKHMKFQHGESIEAWEKRTGFAGTYHSEALHQLHSQTQELLSLDSSLRMDAYPCHCNYNSICCGIFMQIKNGELICNECGMTLLALIDSLRNQ